MRIFLPTTKNSTSGIQVSDFGGQFKGLTESLGSAAKGMYNKFDQWSFKMLVDNLKSNDFDAVSEAVDQLVKEKRLLGIPPLYFVSQVHPSTYARQKAASGLEQFGRQSEIEAIVNGKSVEEATKALIEKFGNYKF